MTQDTTNGIASGVALPEFFLPTQKESSSSDGDDTEELLTQFVSPRRPADKRRRSDPRAQGTSHNLERIARGNDYLDRSPSKKKRMTKVNLETKLYQGARQAGKNGWKSTAKKNRMKAKRTPRRKPLPPPPSSSSSSESDSSIECLRVSPSQSSSMNRLMKARAAKGASVKPRNSLSEASTVSPRPSPVVSSRKAPPPPTPLPFTLPSSLVNEIKRDTLNQSRSAKRHTTSSLGNANRDIVERLSAQDGILDAMATQLITVLGVQLRTRILANEVLEALSNCPHATKKTASPESLGTVTATSGSHSQQQRVGTTGRHGAANGFTVTHNHTHFQQNDFRKKGADQSKNNGTLGHSQSLKRIENPHTKKDLPPNASPPDCKNGGENNFDQPPPPSAGGTGTPTAVHQFAAI